MRKCLVIVCGLVLSMVSGPGFADESVCLRVGIEDTYQHRVVGAALGEFFQDSGLCHTIAYFPGVRLKNKLIEGALDGVAFRTDTYIYQFEESFVRLPTPLLTGRGAIIRLADQDGPIKTFGLLQGEQWAKDFASEKHDVVEVSGYRQGLELVSRHRIDAFILPDLVLEMLDIDLTRYSISFTEKVETFLYVRANLHSSLTALEDAMQSCTGEGPSIVSVSRNRNQAEGQPAMISRSCMAR